ncbi:permease family protein [Halomonas koreensis]|uniref:NCS2 family permease n=1 Tax=Halomonas koreensis TaxID=245385 RepID=A0ABU1FXH9_9GAMM|nr:NCS2 family permease [Halomonas koreensis]MDR5865329.1 NCS2 family permease [Halomonas koreensis]
MHYPIFSRSDLSGFWALFADTLANLLIISGVCRFVFDMPDEIVFGRILPGAAVSIILGIVVYVYLAQRLARREGRTDVTALPYGISTPVMFVYLFGVIGPIYWSTGDPVLAWQVGIAAGVVGGLVEVAGAVTGPWLKRVTPRAGMMGTLSGIALVFIATVALARIYESPIVGFTALAFVLWGLVGRFRLPFNLPAGLTALVAATLVALALGESRISAEGVGFYLPLPYVGDLMVGLQHLFAHPELFAVLIPVQVYNFIETMNNVESAEVVGDRYPVGFCQVTDGVGTMLGGVFGSPFPTTVYIGHPAYKRMQARSGYALGVGLVFFVGALFGLVAFLGNLIPEAAVAPILVFVGISIIAVSFRSCEPKHHVAVAIAFIPHVSNIVIVKWGSVLNALRDMGLENVPGLMDDAFVSTMIGQGAHVIGQSALANGAIVSGMLWGAFTAYLIDRRIHHAVMVAVAAAVLSSVGVIHDAELHWPSLTSPMMWGYLILGAILLGQARLKLVQEAEEEIAPPASDDSERDG